MSGRYANSTDVPVSRSRDEVERTLQKYGATRFGYAWQEDGFVKPSVVIAFRMAERSFRLTMPMPSRSDREFTHHSRGARSSTAAEDAWEQACRSRWRAIALLVKAKLEAVALGVSTIEEEFLSATVVPGSGDRTVWDFVADPLAKAIAEGGQLSITASEWGKRP